MRCRSCGESYKDGYPFCPNCGQKTSSTGSICSNCGYQNRPDSLFCDSCGELLQREDRDITYVDIEEATPTAKAPPPAVPYPQQPPAQPPPPGAYYQQPYYRQAPMARPQNSSKAVASLALGIGGFFVCPLVCCILAIVFGYQAKRDIEASGGRLGGSAMASWGIGLGIAGLLLSFLVIAIAVSGGWMSGCVPVTILTAMLV